MADDITPVPEIAAAIRDVMSRKRMRSGMDLMSQRESGFGSTLEMQLAGMAFNPASRELLNEALTERFAGGFTEARILRDGGYDSPEFSEREFVVGDGYAAAVYCAIRARMGFPKPIVLTRSSPEYVGGTFAWFSGRLNSGNRPGSFGSPKDPGSSVNYLPGGLLQPAMVPGGDFHYGSDIALCIRLALAQFAQVVTDCPVQSLAGASGTPLGARVILESGAQYDAKRVLDARGLGDPSFTDETPDLMAFPSFCKKMRGPWPLRGIRRAAVVGDGKSALCAVEDLLGITPGIAGLDRVERVDLYAPRLPQSYRAWREDLRVRYLAAAREIGKRLFIYGSRVTPVSSYNGVVIGGTTYDMGVMCTGFTPDRDARFDYFDYEGRGLATWAEPYEVFRIGVRSSMPFSEAERAQGLADEDENKDAMFRYGPRIAALAATLK